MMRWLRRLWGNRGGALPAPEPPRPGSEELPVVEPEWRVHRAPPPPMQAGTSLKNLYDYAQKQRELDAGASDEDA